MASRTPQADALYTVANKPGFNQLYKGYRFRDGLLSHPVPGSVVQMLRKGGGLFHWFPYVDGATFRWDGKNPIHEVPQKPKPTKPSRRKKKD